MPGEAVIRVLRAGAIALVAGLSLGGGASCGGSDVNDRQRIEAALNDLRTAFERRDWSRACARLSRSAQRQAGLLAHSYPQECVGDLREAFRVVDSGRGMQRGEAIEVADVHLDGDRATATLAVDGRRADIPLVRERERWTVDSFFGVSPGEATRAAARSRSASFPRPAGGRAAAAVRAGQPCLDVSTLDYPALFGDCELAVSGEEVALEILTPFGHFRFGECSVRYHAWIDGEGLAFTDSFSVNSPLNNGCADVLACDSDTVDEPPWKGRLGVLGDGRYSHTMRACLATCVGYFVGELTFTLVRSSPGWRVEAAAAEVGASGLRFAGDLDVEGGFDARPVRG